MESIGVGDSMRVSVVVPCFRMGLFIETSLASVGAQTYSSWELIAIDDCGPEDGTRGAVQAFAAAHPDKRVVFRRLPENRGVSAARNEAIRQAKGGLVAFLDPDDWWEADYLELQVRRLQGECAPDIVYTGTLMVDANGGRLGAWEPPSGFDDAMPESIFSGNYINPSATMVRRELLLSVGGFDETPALQHVEDWDLWIRLALVDAKFQRSSAPRVNYRQHPGAACADRNKVRERCLALMTKHGSSPRVMKCLMERAERAEAELAKLRTDYADLLHAHSCTLDRRLKGLINRIIGRSK